MDTKSFIKALRTIIREEVQTAVRTELRSLLTERTNQTYTPPVTETVINAKKQSQKPKSFVKDPLLNELLNDTASRPINLSEGATLSFSSEMAQAFASSKTAVAPIHDLDGKPVDMQKESVATVVNAMTKDYSALMKAIDKKKGVR